MYFMTLDGIAISGGAKICTVTPRWRTHHAGEAEGGLRENLVGYQDQLMLTHQENFQKHEEREKDFPETMWLEN